MEKKKVYKERKNIGKQLTKCYEINKSDIPDLKRQRGQNSEPLAIYKVRQRHLFFIPYREKSCFI